MKTAETPAGTFTINKSEIPCKLHMCSRTENRTYQRKPYTDRHYGSGSIIRKSDTFSKNPSKLYES